VDNEASPCCEDTSYAARASVVERFARAVPPAPDDFVARMRVPHLAGGHPQTRPDYLCGDKAYSSRRNRRYLRRQVRHTIPERRDQRGQDRVPRSGVADHSDRISRLWGRSDASSASSCLSSAGTLRAEPSAVAQARDRAVGRHDRLHHEKGHDPGQPPSAWQSRWQARGFRPAAVCPQEGSRADDQPAHDVPR
jgi:hypothetical protein